MCICYADLAYTQIAVWLFSSTTCKVQGSGVLLETEVALFLPLPFTIILGSKTAYRVPVMRKQVGR